MVADEERIEVVGLGMITLFDNSNYGHIK